jgi:hypothetical protein
MKPNSNMVLKRKDLNKPSVRTFTALSAQTFFGIQLCAVKINTYSVVLVSPDI